MEGLRQRQEEISSSRTEDLDGGNEKNESSLLIGKLEL